MEILGQFAATETATLSLITVLGIDWMMLTFQIVAFLITVLLLSKFVYPWLMKSVDERQHKIETSAKATAEAQEAADHTEKRIVKLLSKAQIEADEIVASAKAESTATIAAAEESSKKRADQIIASAQREIDSEILLAKKAIQNEMVELVALATEKVVGKVVSDKIDNKLIIDSIKEAK